MKRKSRATVQTALLICSPMPMWEYLSLYFTFFDELFSCPAVLQGSNTVLAATVSEWSMIQFNVDYSMYSRGIRCFQKSYKNTEPTMNTVSVHIESIFVCALVCMLLHNVGTITIALRPRRLSICSIIWMCTYYFSFVFLSNLAFIRFTSIIVHYFIHVFSAHRTVHVCKTLFDLFPQNSIYKYTPCGFCCFSASNNVSAMALTPQLLYFISTLKRFNDLTQVCLFLSESLFFVTGLSLFDLVRCFIGSIIPFYQSK